MTKNSLNSQIEELVDFILESHGHSGCGTACPVINEAYEAIQDLITEARIGKLEYVLYLFSGSSKALSEVGVIKNRISELNPQPTEGKR